MTALHCKKIAKNEIYCYKESNSEKCIFGTIQNILKSSVVTMTTVSMEMCVLSEEATLSSSLFKSNPNASYGPVKNTYNKSAR